MEWAWPAPHPPYPGTIDSQCCPTLYRKEGTHPMLTARGCARLAPTSY